ncbi:meprin A subunit beta-like [Engraulis encrasicolus]|uniref:meprin A subunit beta-like n=1 Tax=Engraulis encrasicolus TaxID=184585 RepID=UPI002FD280BB
MLVPFLLALNTLGTCSLPTLHVLDLEDEAHSIYEINEDAGLDLFDGDIIESNVRSSLLNENARWDNPVPYVMTGDLGLHAKGIILRALEQFRLKTCIDFTPRQNQNPYISIDKRGGCWSYVGKVFSGEQVISIGSGCEWVDIVEHELLHALGFYHEQSRYDRDDHVTIVWENIQTGRENNFLKKSQSTISLLDTLYDYTSVMHYRASAFSNGNGNTILTSDPEFQDVIGKSTEMSSTDVLELNRLYCCDAAVSFMEHCSFDDEGMCNMTVLCKEVSGWKRVSQIDGGPYSDHTQLGTNQQGNGFFMHFSTVKGNEGDSSRLITRRMTPTRPCQVQCLQFYDYYNGNETDQLNIWIREFDSEDDVEGTRKLIGQVTGLPHHYWKIHHVPLNASKTFQVEFVGHKGSGSSSGGFSVDDINLSETECPHQTLQIQNFEERLSTSGYTDIESPRYYSTDGYGYQFLISLRGTYFGLYVRLVSGDYDEQLEWPLAWRQFTFLVVDQNPHTQLRMSNQRSITADPAFQYYGSDFWGNPREVGGLIGNGETFYVSHRIGYSYEFG